MWTARLHLAPVATWPCSHGNLALLSRALRRWLIIIQMQSAVLRVSLGFAFLRKLFPSLYLYNLKLSSYIQKLTF